MELRRVVIAIDFSERSLHAARWAARNFATGLDIVLVHAVTLPEPPPFLRGRFPNLPDVEESARTNALSRLRDVARSMPASGVRSEVRIGNAAEQIAAGLPNAQLYAFEGKGHLPIFTATDEFCEVLRRFVRTGTATA